MVNFRNLGKNDAKNKIFELSGFIFYGICINSLVLLRFKDINVLQNDPS